jgi:serine/threonine-protein kinase
VADPKRIGDYEIDCELGEGGAAVVYRAHSADGTIVALKVLRPELADDAQSRERFAREIRVAREIRDRHLVQIVDAGEHDGRPYVALEYLPGGSLVDRLAKGVLSVHDMLRLVGELAAGLEVLHRRGLVHRDVKPSNVMFREDGSAALTDFGLARAVRGTVLTMPGQVLGTLDYLAPELVRGGEPTAASDIYALGCVAFECLAGTPPFGDRSLLSVGTAHLEHAPPDPPAPPELAWALTRALEKDPEARPASASMYANLLRVAAR